MNEENFSDKTKSKRRITFDSNELRCIVSPCKIFNSQYNELSYQIFDFWRKSWTDTFKQIDKDFAQTSEEYCRHHRVVALQYQGEIIACALLDLFDLHSPIHKEHKYFLAYPTPVYSDFLKLAETRPVMTVGYLTVDPRFKLQPFIAQLLSGLCLLHYYSSETQLLITYTRNTKRVNQLAFRFGGIPIAENLIAFGEPTDFVYFTQQQLMSLQQHPYFEDFYSFWNERLEITHTHNTFKGDQSMKKLTAQIVYNRMLESINELEQASQRFNWENTEHYAEWLAQSYMYVRWTTRQLALASAMTKPSTEDILHWRFIEEANEEKNTSFWF